TCALPIYAVDAFGESCLDAVDTFDESCLDTVNSSIESRLDPVDPCVEPRIELIQPRIHAPNEPGEGRGEAREHAHDSDDRGEGLDRHVHTAILARPNAELHRFSLVP